MATRKKSKPKKPAWFVLSCATIALEEVVPKGASKLKPGATAGMPGDSQPPRQYKVKIKTPERCPPGGLFATDHVHDLSAGDEPLLVDGNRVSKRDLDDLLQGANEHRERLEAAKKIKDPAERAHEMRFLDGCIVSIYTQSVTFGAPVLKKAPTKKVKKSAKKRARRAS